MEWIETLFCSKGKVELLELHLERLKWGLYQNVNQNVDAVIENARKAILGKLPHDDNFYRFRFLLSLNEAGHFFNKTEIIQIEKPAFSYLRLGIYTGQTKAVSVPWNAKTTQRDLYQAAADWAMKNGFDDAIILNEKGVVIETTIFNIFILSGGILYTPPLSDMPVKGVFRSWLMKHSVFPVIEKSLSKEDLMHAEYILLTNALRGLQLGKLSHP